MPFAGVVALTTVRQPKTEMGRRAATVLPELLEGKELEAQITVPGELAVRGSTAPVGGNSL